MPQQRRQGRGAPTTARLPLIGAYSNRETSGTKDQRFVNIFPESRKVDAIDSTKIVLQKRPGLTLYKDFGTGEGRGVYYFNNKLYIALGNTIYEDGVTPTAKITMSTSTGHVGMVAGNSSTLGDYLFICDGTGGWVIKSDGTVLTIGNDYIRSTYIASGGTGFTNGTYSLGVSGGGGTGFAGTYTCSGGIVTTITITNAGTGYTSDPTLSFPSGGGSAVTAYAYVNDFPIPHTPTPVFMDGYIVLPQKSDVYSCILDEPQNWDSGQYLTAEMFPDSVKALARQNNLIVVFGETSTEFFYDAANVSGSPFGRNDATVNQIGIAFPYAIYQNENTCMFTGQSESGGRAVWMFTGTQAKKISDEYIEKILDTETNTTGVKGFGLRTLGHLFYVITLPTVNRTFLYDTDEKLWHEWSSNISGDHQSFQYNYSVDTYLGYVYLLHKSDGTLCKLDPTTYQDNGVSILVELVTNKFDMNTYVRKFMTNLKVVADQYTSTTSVDLTWTDDDYQTWSNTKTIALTDVYPAFFRGGQFRRRAFRIKNAQNTALRLEAIEISYLEGDT